MRSKPGSEGQETGKLTRIMVVNWFKGQESEEYQKSVKLSKHGR